MKHTKNILKSLLITVMALSLLSVSCSKDEGGSKNPVNPTPITIDAATLDGAIELAAARLATDTTLSDKVTFNFTDFTSAGGKGNASATVNKAVTGTVLKTALEVAFTLDDASFSSKATLTTDSQNKKKATLTITITVKGNNTFASDVKGKYAEVNGDSKSVETVITITGKQDIISQ